MANPEHVQILCKGPEAWNTWRQANPDVRPDLSRIQLPGDTTVAGTLDGADFRHADLSHMTGLGGDRDWSGAVPSMRNADFSGADLRCAYFWRADFQGSSFRDANLDKAEFEWVDLDRTQMIGTSVRGAVFRKVSVYGVSAWDIESDESTVFEDLTVKGPKSDPIVVDHLDVAQFVYMLLQNSNIRRVLDNVTAKAVLILGRFEPKERKPILDRLRELLRERGYVPILFDFSKPSSRDLTETISTLAHISRCVVADITSARSVPQELMAIVPSLPSVPVAPLIAAGQREYAMYEHFRRYPWVLPLVTYETESDLVERLDSDVLCPLETKLRETRPEG